MSPAGVRLALKELVTEVRAACANATGQAAVSAILIAFTTGRGPCFALVPAPTIKPASNTPMFKRMRNDMDINCGTVVDGESDLQTMGQAVFELILRMASGLKSQSELVGMGENDSTPWPIGVLA